MKFGKSVQGELQRLPADVRDHCLDYRSWKKRVHEPRLVTAAIWKLRLARECSRLDTFLKGLRGRVDQETLDRLMLLNTDILYKVCKRLQKRCGVPAMQYYKTVLRRHEYAFTSVSFMTLVPDYHSPSGLQPDGATAEIDACA